MNFLFRKGILQLNSCNKHLLTDGEHTTAEITLWHDEECKTTRHTIASFQEHKEGYDLKFVGDRPFSNEVNVNDFMYLAELGQNILMNHFNNSR